MNACNLKITLCNIDSDVFIHTLPYIHVPELFEGGPPMRDIFP
jgi:hypothetical protein